MQVLQEADGLVVSVSPLEKNKFHFSQRVVKCIFSSAVYIFMSMPVISACCFAVLYSSSAFTWSFIYNFPMFDFLNLPSKQKKPPHITHNLK